jgi:homoserine kinase
VPESLVISAPATSANLGPGFDSLAVALDISNAVVITRRPGPLAVRVTGEGAGELPEDGSNLVCKAMRLGLDDLDGLDIECKNRIPLGRGLGSSAAAVCAGLVAANALGSLRWSPDEILEHAVRLEGHADNAAACRDGGLVAVTPGPVVEHIEVPEGLGFVTVIPSMRVATDAARMSLPDAVPLGHAAQTVAHAIGLTLALAGGRLDDIGAHLTDYLHEPYRAPSVPGLDALRALAGVGGCLGVTISGSGPSVLIWCRSEAASEVAGAATTALGDDAESVTVRVTKVAPVGVRARWTSAEGRLERSIG